MKLQTKKWIRLSVILYIVILSAVAVATLAWFVIDETASLQTDTDMKITTGNKLEIRPLDADGNPDENYQWGQMQNIDVEDRTYPDITYDYINKTFYFPTSVDENGQAVDESYREVSDSISKDYYITVNLRFRSTLKMEVYLEDDSYVSGLAQTLVGDGSDNKSSFGNFSRDGIAGAVRVAFFERDPHSYDGQQFLRNIWVPNDTYKLTTNTSDGQSPSYTFSTGENMADPTQNIETDLGYMSKQSDGTMIKKVWTQNDYLDRIVTLGSQELASVEDADGNDVTPMINNAAPVITFTDADLKESGFYEKDLVIKIWIEGTDREANSVFTDGQLKYNFKFSGVQKDTNPVDDPKNENSFENRPVIYEEGKLYFKPTAEGAEKVAVTQNDNLLYSFDGKFWSPYNNSIPSNSMPVDAEFFYVKYGETSLYKASKYTSVMLVPVTD